MNKKTVLCSFEDVLVPPICHVLWKNFVNGKHFKCSKWHHEENTFGTYCQEWIYNQINFLESDSAIFEFLDSTW